MSLPPKAPPVYKPASQRVAAPPVYRPQQKANASLQSKPVGNFRQETRPAPSVFKPASADNAVFPKRSSVPIGSASQRKFAYHSKDEVKTAFSMSPQLGNQIAITEKHRPAGQQVLQKKSKAYNLNKLDQPIELGGCFSGRLFLFRGSHGSTNLIISAHGGASKDTKTIDVPPGVTIHFYGLHGDAIANPGLVLPDEGHPQKGTGEKVTNYTFSKFQGEDTGETYDNIVNTILVPGFDVLTVRKRWYGKQITLKDTLAAINGRGYTDIYLNACRYVPEMGEADINMRKEDISSKGYVELA